MDKELFSLNKPVAILVDGSFFLKRYAKCFKNGSSHTPEQVAKNMYTMLMSHVEHDRLYRIFFYDCPPLMKRVHNPITKKSINLAKTEVAQFRIQFHGEIIKMRKVALRIGYLKDPGGWVIRESKVKDLLNRNISIDDLKENDVYYNIKQKGVDIRIGLDIASLAYKKLVSRIILVSGDSDFVPAAKLARREGIDFILDPMWISIDSNLFEHIDGLQSKCKKP